MYEGNGTVLDGMEHLPEEMSDEMEHPLQHQDGGLQLIEWPPHQQT